MLLLSSAFQHFIGQREEFETARDSILVWLTEMDLQLTNIEHFSECDVQAKIKQLKVIDYFSNYQCEESLKRKGFVAVFVKNIANNFSFEKLALDCKKKIQKI